MPFSDTTTLVFLLVAVAGMVGTGYWRINAAVNSAMVPLKADLNQLWQKYDEAAKEHRDLAIKLAQHDGVKEDISELKQSMLFMQQQLCVLLDLAKTIVDRKII